jgi:hypothetical protein
MKVSFQGKLRKFSKWPSNIEDFRRVIGRKFSEKLDDFHKSNVDQSMQSLMNNSGFQSMLDNNLSMRDKSIRDKAKRQPTINWTQVTCFYEDSEGDMNVISEDEDLNDAYKYYQTKRFKRLELSILDRTQYKTFRDEQDRNPLNQSISWLDSDMNLFSKQAR